MDKMREEFEAWWVVDNDGNPPLSGWESLRTSDGYNDEIVDIQWEAWQASRKALVVNIDSHTEFEIEHIASPKEDGYAKGWIDGRNYSVRQVMTAGITVKGEGDE